MKGYLVGLLAASALFTGATQAGSDSFDDRIYGGAMWNYIDADNANRGISDSRDGFRLLVGKQLSPRFALEATGSYNEFDPWGPAAPIVRRQTEASLGLEALAFPFRCTGDVRPFLKAGIGGTAYNEDWDMDFNASVGAGMLWKLNDHGTSFRSDVAWRYLDSDGSFPPSRGDGPTEWVFGAGFTVPIGGAPVVNEGCAKAEPAAVAPAPEPAPAAPVDSDGDGVMDGVDKCPNTPAGAKVDANGCPLPETVVIYFAFDSDVLNTAAKAALDRVSANLLNRNFVVAIANGHADSTGTEEYNMSLSQRRANSVSKYLAGKGVAAGQIRQRAYGESQPAADDSTEIGRAKNRRVEINLLRQ